MPTKPMGAVNPALMAHCPERPRPENADKLPVHVTPWGDSGPSVLLVHGGVQGGIGGGPVNYEGQKPLAERDWRLRLIDRPGFGESPSRGADDMEADSILIAELLGNGSHLIGHSFGGAEALLAAARRPDAVRSLILIEPALQPMRLAMANTDASAQKDAIVGFVLSATSPGEFAINFARSMGRSEDGGDNVSVANIIDDPDKAAALGCSLLRSQAVSPQEMLAAAHAVRDAGIRTLVVSGGYSDRQEASCDLVASETGGKRVVIDCGSHFIQQAKPAEFNDIADRFMRDAERARS
ncbi:alpha/beta hydrolase [Sphingomonas sp. CGMCC 1.13654]|uniref:Alpha/beta hydrolase n=1 Tax=Sphingomonas chungangi TaxID=2683589 RepID=A0A838L2U7_9SPHN|nr:alpha/beta hydrolase [Sphingomonas chungangi]MBA2933514.1 alpha/beta hydrolase [Sphingomonas chungangi]MVW54847.1 alpha/beta fold hydrolase [Sphingomonas chungangi]